LVPQTLLRVVDRAIQAYGGAGVSQDTPLAYMYAAGRTMRLVDGPDEVHMLQLGRNENKRGKVILEKLETQMKAVKALFERSGTELEDPLKLNRVSKAHL
jgi:acyl-CoA dehydrogenase